MTGEVERVRYTVDTLARLPGREGWRGSVVPAPGINSAFRLIEWDGRKGRQYVLARKLEAATKGDAADHGVPQHRERLFILAVQARVALGLALPRRDHVGVGQVIDWNGHRWAPIDKPGRSPATLRRLAAGRARFGRRFVAPYYGKGSGLTGRSIDRPIGTITTLDRWAVVDGDLMRMLQPAELKWGSRRAICCRPSAAPQSRCSATRSLRSWPPTC